MGKWKDLAGVLIDNRLLFKDYNCRYMIKEIGKKNEFPEQNWEIYISIQTLRGMKATIAPDFEYIAQQL